MKGKKFFFLLLTICLFGFFLRTIDYEKVPPYDESFDEIFYTWGGFNWLENGTPKSWSWFETYKNEEYLDAYGIHWRLVWPLIEKPPLYFWLAGLNARIWGVDNIYQVSHRVIRVLPLVLSLFTLFFVGLLGEIIFGKLIGLMGVFLCATVPSIILANRMSLTENLITPILLFCLILIVSENRKKRSNNIRAILIGIGVVLAFLTKQIGFVVALSTLCFYLILKSWRKMIIVGTFTFFGILVYLLIGYYYDWQLFWGLVQQWRIAHSLSGLPEITSAIFRYQGIGPKNHPFLDGSILISLLLLFSSPLWLLAPENKQERQIAWKTWLKVNPKISDLNWKKLVLLIPPFFYLVLLTIGESGQGPFTYFGWYIYPLYPFLMIILAKFLIDFFKRPTFFILVLILTTLGLSTIRFLFLILGRQYYYLWQYAFGFIVLLGIFGFFTSSGAIRKKVFILMALFFIVVNIIIDFRLLNIYSLAISGENLELFNP